MVNCNCGLDNIDLSNIACLDRNKQHDKVMIDKNGLIMNKSGELGYIKRITSEKGFYSIELSYSKELSDEDVIKLIEELTDIYNQMEK